VFNDNHMAFLTLSKGYRPGGINAGGAEGSSDADPTNLLGLNVAQITAFVDAATGTGDEGAPEQYDAEFINSIEFGNKSSFLDGRLVANGTAFYYDYDGLHLTVVTETLIATTNSSAEDPNTNQAKDEDGNPRTAGAAGSGDVIKDLSGNPLPGSPESSVKLALAYTFNIMDGYSLLARVDHFFQDEYFVNQFAKNTDAVAGWKQTDFQLVLSPNDGTWKARAYLKNIENNKDITYIGQDGSLVGRFRTVNVLEPRLYGVEFSYTF
jgi:iron complex outermembrane receptor protein